MAIVIDELESLENQTTAIQVINNNFEKILEALEDLQATRDAPLDMNGYAIFNLPAPSAASNPLRLGDAAELTIDAAAVLPPKAGNENKFITTDGTSFVFSDVDVNGYLAVANNLSDLPDPSAARTNLELGSAALLDEATVVKSGQSYTWTGSQEFSGALTLSGTGNHQLTATPTTLTPQSIGYRGLIVKTANASQTLTLSDAGSMWRQTSSTNRTYTIPTNASVALPIGTVIVIRNVGTGVVTVTPSGGVNLRQPGSSSSGSVAVNQWGLASLTKEAANDWIITGIGIS